MAEYRQVIPGELVVRGLPGTLEPQVHWKFLPLVSQEQAPCFVASIPHGRVWGAAGAVITPDDILLADVSRTGARPGQQHAASLRIQLGPLRKIGGRVAVLSTVWSDVYFHWMLDMLPRAGLLRLAGLFDSVDTFIVPPCRYPYQMETLAALGLAADRLLVADDEWRFHVCARELVVPSFPSAADTPRDWSCRFLRESFGQMNGAQATGRRIYLSRDTARGRRIVNEAEIGAFLAKLGFEKIELLDLTVARQAELFASAEIIVAPHGAGLTNLVFCRPGTTVIDMFSPNYVNPCYWVICQGMGLKYYYLLGEGNRPPEGIDPDLKLDNIQVSTGALRRLLTLAGF